MMKTVESLFTVMMLLSVLVIANSEVYIVTLEGEPLISYTGGINGFEATTVESDETLDVTSDSVTSYSQHLEERHDRLLETLFDDGNYKKLYIYKHVINGFAVHVSQEHVKFTSFLYLSYTIYLKLLKNDGENIKD